MELNKIRTGNFDKTAFREILNEQFLKKTGISLENYKNEELLEKITDLLIFPKYAISKIFVPVFAVFIGLWIACLLLFQFDSGLSFLLLILGSILAIPNGILLGILNLSSSLSADIRKILSLSTETVKNVLNDLKNLRTKIKDKEFDLPKLSEILKGVIHVIILPSLTQIIKKKFPFLGRLFSNLLERIFETVQNKILDSVEKSEKIEKLEEKIETTKEEGLSKINTFLSKSIEKIDQIQQNADNLAKISIKTINLPIRLFTSAFAGVSALFLLLMLWIFR